MSKTLLIVDDDENVIKLFSLDLEQRNDQLSIRSARSGTEAVHMLKQQEPDVLVLDLRMREGDGFEVLEHLKASAKQIPVVVLTNYNNEEYVRRCESLGVKDYLIKHQTRMDRVVDTVMEHLQV